MQQDLTMGRTQMVFATLSSGIAFFSLDAKRTGGPAARFNKVIHADLTRPIDRVDQAQVALLPGTVGSSVTITDDVSTTRHGFRANWTGKPEIVCPVLTRISRHRCTYDRNFWRQE
jgi:hypothetical protein